MITVTFWGGPKDGEVIRQNTKVPKEIFCATNESALMEAEQFDKIRNFPNRSQEYFKYILEYIDDSVAKYTCVGIE